MSLILSILFLFIDNAMHEIAATTAKYFDVVIEDICFYELYNISVVIVRYL